MALKVPVDLDERTVSAHGERDRRTGQTVADPALDSLVEAVRFAREQAGSLVSLETAAMADKTQTTEAAIFSVASAALKTGERVAARLDAARSKVTAEIASIEKLISQCPPPRDAVALGMEREIREALARMSDDQRSATIAEAFANKDESILGAVLRGPAMLVNMKPAAHAMLKHRYQTEFHPAEHARRERLAKALEATDRAGRSLVALVGKATAGEAARMAAASASRRCSPSSRRGTSRWSRSSSRPVVQRFPSTSSITSAPRFPRPWQPYRQC